MNKPIQKILSLLLAFVSLLSSLSITCFALEWDGSSTGGGGNTTYAGPNGYAIRTDGDNLIAYRFSVVNKSGANKVSKVIDVFRNTSYGNYEYTNAYKFATKYNKKQLINNQNSGFSTGKSTTNCYKEADMGFATKLPTADGMKTWQNNTTNLNKILSTLGVGAIANLKNGDKILVEPLYDLRFQSIYHAVTITETAIYGKYILGASSDGGASSNSGSWGFISSYTNKYYPNQLYTPDGQGLWTGVSAASKRLTFYNMINQGYGVGIAYTETKSDFSPTLSVNKCEAWPGSKGARNNNHYGTSTGNAFANWTYGHDYPYSGATIWYAVNFPAETENCYVKQTVTVVGGGTTSRNVYSKDGTWYDVALSPTTVPNDKSYITVKAKVDWIDSSGKVLKNGAEKSFYIPIKPTVYRYQVSAVNYSGEVQAYNGSGGKSGMVYVGQKVYAKYKYTAKNTWSSSNKLYAIMHKWGGSDWTRVDGSKSTDLSVTASLSSSSSHEGTSTLGYVRVPNNSGSGSNVMHFKMTTQWETDPSHTKENTWIDIPIVKSDVELFDMYLVDSNGYIVDRSNLTVGQTVTVYHQYKNNTDTKIFVNGFNDDGSQISGVYAIPANEKITVAGASFTVPNKRTFSIWGGVYLEGAGKGNTNWETNGKNNSLTINCKSNHPVTIVPITPNASYRENTEVISSFRIYNGCSKNYTPSDNLKVRFKVTKTNDSQIYTETKTAIVPANDNNLIYFRWKVPTGLNGASVVVKAEILEDGTAYNPRTNNRSTVPYTYYKTPDTQYEEKAPTGFSVPSAPATSQNYATWSEYVYQSGAFVKKNYGICNYASSTVTITPADGNSATKDASGKWTMKSGYGVWVEGIDTTANVSGYLSPSTNAYTRPQYCTALFPEYQYQSTANKCNTLYYDSATGKWQFNVLNASKSNRDYHFTPLYFPDGQYIVKIVKSDMWTPAGMIQSIDTTKPITISGNAYDDWYVGRRT